MLALRALGRVTVRYSSGSHERAQWSVGSGSPGGWGSQWSEGNGELWGSHNGMRSVRALGVQSGVGLWSHHRSLWSEVSKIPQRSKTHGGHSGIWATGALGGSQ